MIVLDVSNAPTREHPLRLQNRKPQKLNRQLLSLRQRHLKPIQGLNLAHQPGGWSSMMTQKPVFNMKMDISSWKYSITRWFWLIKKPTAFTLGWCPTRNQMIPIFKWSSPPERPARGKLDIAYSSACRIIHSVTCTMSPAMVHTSSVFGMVSRTPMWSNRPSMP